MVCFVNSKEHGNPLLESEKKEQKIRKCKLSLIALIYLGLGIFIISYTNSYITKALDLCANPSDDFLKQHFELYFWGDCKKQVNIQIVGFLCVCEI